MREVLKMIISTHQDKEAVSLSLLCDRLESHLRALETSGVISKYSAMLLPLVKSCFLEEFLIVWNWRVNATQQGEAKDRIRSLMQFLRLEVEGEERTKLAMTGVGLVPEGSTESFKKRVPFKKNTKEEVPTAAGLLSSSKIQETKTRCVFCDKAHASSECFLAQKMELSYTGNLLRKRGCCFSCLKPGHVAQLCKTKFRCAVCVQRRVTVMCREWKTKGNPQAKADDEHDVTLTSLMGSPKVILQTLKVKLRSEHQEVCVRALIDTGSQKFIF